MPALSAALATFRRVELLDERLGCRCRFGFIRLPLLNMGMSLVEVLVGKDGMTVETTDESVALLFVAAGKLSPYERQ